MFNNVALDVFIGLVVIYLLYSLFITIISEMIVTWMGLRSRILRLSIEKMLNDGYLQQYRGPLHFIQRYFLKEFKQFKYSFAGKFYAHPSIKYLSSKTGEQTTFFSQTKPSYISADMFAETLIQLLKEKGVGTTDMDKVRFTLKFNTYNIQPSTLRHLNNLVEAAGNDPVLLKEKFKAWYKETQDRATGWFKRKLQLILFWLGFIVAVIFNVDTIRITKILAEDKDARNQLVSMGIELAKDSSRYAAFINEKGDTIHSQPVLDSGFARVQRNIQEAELVLGLGWDTDKTKDHFYIIPRSQKKKFSSITATDIQDLHVMKNGLLQAMQSSKQFDVNVDTVNQQIHGAAVDTLNWKLQLSNIEIMLQRDSIRLKNPKAAADTTLKKRMDGAKREIDSLRSLIDSSGKLVSMLTRQIPLIKEKKEQNRLFEQNARKYLKAINERIDSVSENEFLTIDSVAYMVNILEDKNNISKRDTVALIVLGKRKLNWSEKAVHIIKGLGSLHTLIGLIITALMLSLGAPFWFDLLKKLVALRGSGVKPEEKKPTPEDEILPEREIQRGNPPVQVEVPEPNVDIYTAAIKEYGPAIKKIPGVKSIIKGVSANGPEVQINVDNQATAAVVRTRFPVLRIVTTNIIPLVVVTGVPISHASNDKGCISNKSQLNGIGSLGCILTEKDSPNIHLLSCWHVLKGDKNYDSDDNHKTILDEANRDLASRWAGGIQDAFDFSIALCFPNSSILDNDFLRTALGLAANFKFIPREIGDVDINKQIPVKYYDSISQNPIVQAGIIYTHCPELEIHYDDKVRVLKDILVLTRSVATQIAISQRGNSGAIVFDAANRPIAMIIGGDQMYSYAVKLSNIFSIHSEMSIA